MTAADINIIISLKSEIKLALHDGTSTTKDPILGNIAAAEPSCLGSILADKKQPLSLGRAQRGSRMFGKESTVWRAQCEFLDIARA